MKPLIIEKIARVLKNKKKLEKALNVKIENRGKEVSISGEPEDEYVAEKIILALEFGFPFSTALLIKKQELIFETLNIKDYAKTKNLARIRGRIIGTQGKTLKTLTDLTDCYFEMKDNQIGIIGDPLNLKNASEALIFLIKGSKQGNVYAGLAKQKNKEIEEDLGLRE